jgi:hypothetical protein
LPFSTAAAAGGLIALSMAPVAFIWLKEPKTAGYQVSAVAAAYRELRSILASRPLWIAVGFIFIASIPQTFPTPLWHYQKTALQFSDTTIGYLLGAAGVGSVIAAVAYGVMSPLETQPYSYLLRGTSDEEEERLSPYGRTPVVLSLGSTAAEQRGVFCISVIYVTLVSG